MSIRGEVLEYALPLRWELDHVERLLALEAAAPARIGSFYGCVNLPGFRSGRLPLPHQDVSLEAASRVVSRIHAAGRTFHYLFNVPLAGSVVDVDAALLDDVLAATGCDAVVVADLRLAEFIRMRHPDLGLIVSTVADIHDAVALEDWVRLGPRRVVLPHDLPRRPAALREVLSALKARAIEPEMMVTESCLFGCPWRAEHYGALGRGESDASFHARCRQLRMAQPERLLSPGSFVRPQDVPFYRAHFGVRHFKITGRSQTAAWLERVAASYLRGSFEGNLVELMGMDPTIFPADRFSLGAAALDGYLEALFADGTEGANERLARERAGGAGGAC